MKDEIIKPEDKKPKTRGREEARTREDSLSPPRLLASRPTPHPLLSLIGIGPGDLQQMTLAAHASLRAAEIVIGYEVYIELVRPMLRPEQQIVISPIGSEMERAQQAVDLAISGRHVALISSGDIGIYAMASPVFEVLRQRGWSGQEPEVEVFPGISAVQAAAARLGAPLGHDFCTISLSDLLTPWPVIERRLQAAAWGDFVVAFYNPRSQKRDWQLLRAVEILLAYRPATTPVAVVHHVTRPEERIDLTTLGELQPAQVDMFTLVLVGNSQSYVLAGHVVTPRGYGEAKRRGDEDAGREETKENPPASSPHISSPPPGADVYPVSLINMSGQQALVVGGGPVGERKARGVLAAGGAVRLISPEATPQLQAWAEAGQIQWERRPFQPGDVTGVGLVFAATNQRAVNAQVAAEAHQLGLLRNVADQPGEGNFHVPAVHRQPGLVVAVSSLGESPIKARQVRDQIAGWLRDEG
ncbi:MAG: precorrin-3B C(17)-methyltransferase [Anaerolineae bacterium]|nr:precorrin-3B C(17)-methyltransferase [Anaerolineales bacterium]MCQ3972317.1 precorrin-3B C(17)-methyltransferase [Anaerolineae bacterium]